MVGLSTVEVATVEAIFSPLASETAMVAAASPSGEYGL